MKEDSLNKEPQLQVHIHRVGPPVFSLSSCTAWRLTPHRVYFLKLVMQEDLSHEGLKLRLSLYTLKPSRSSGYLHSGA